MFLKPIEIALRKPEHGEPECLPIGIKQGVKENPKQDKYRFVEFKNLQDGLADLYKK